MSPGRWSSSEPATARNWSSSPTSPAWSTPAPPADRRRQPGPPADRRRRSAPPRLRPATYSVTRGYLGTRRPDGACRPTTPPQVERQAASGRTHPGGSQEVTMTMIVRALRRPSRPAASTRNEPTPDRSSPGESPSAAIHPGSGSISSVPGHQRLRQVVLATGVLGGALAPSIHDTGQASIAANAAANPTTNAAHLAAFVLASFLLPIGAIGLARLAYPRTPWLATIGGLLAVVGWLPFSALAALDDLTSAMAQLPNSGSYAELLDRFSTDAVMGTHLLVYVIGHLVAYVLLGAALLRGRVIPRWAAWSMIASSPLTIAAFALPGSPRATGAVAFTLLLLGSLPAARATFLDRRPSVA